MVDSDTNWDGVCANYMKALGDPLRLQIVRALQDGPQTVSELADRLELELQKVSHHLQILFHAHLITQRRQGKFRYYELNASLVRGRRSNQSLDFGCCRVGLWKAKE